ncbi:MAG TPA: methyltransferase [Polyangiaceae bacterium]|nr:methyltransferase [Polyangiaceae bacterium]
MAALHHPGDDHARLAEQLTEIAAWLARWRAVWSHRPFRQLPAPWEADHPAVSRWLRQLSGVDVARYDDDVAKLTEGPPRLAAWTREGMVLTWTPDAIVAPTDLRERWERGVPGRKRAQIRAFVGALVATLDETPGRWLDWCAGKGHLGRALASTIPAPVTFVERQAALARQASERARTRGLDATHLIADVLRDAVEAPTDGMLVALHACGALGDAAITTTLRAGVRAMALIPCCYHYQPGHERLVARSRAGRRALLDVVPQQLRFATAEEVAAPHRRRRGREREEAFRLALDELLREASGRDVYHHLPPVPRPWLNLPFSAWATRVANAHALSLPVRWDPDRFERRGWERARLARALGLARTPFRRALELWYVLDRALSLADGGYRVQVMTACARRVTPRNVIITARV